MSNRSNDPVTNMFNEIFTLVLWPIIKVALLVGFAGGAIIAGIIYFVTG